MLYWVTGTATSSVRLYAEFDRALRAGRLPFGARIDVPTGYARYPKEIMRTSRRWAERNHNLVHFAALPRGGHFAGDGAAGRCSSTTSAPASGRLR